MDVLLIIFLIIMKTMTITSQVWIHRMEPPQEQHLHECGYISDTLDSLDLEFLKHEDCLFHMYPLFLS